MEKGKNPGKARKKEMLDKRDLIGKTGACSKTNEEICRSS